MINADVSTFFIVNYLHKYSCFFVLHIPTLCGDFCFMDNYIDFANYFEQIATEHLKINHSPTKKKFYRMDIEEFISGTGIKLPAATEGPALVFINYITDFMWKGSHTVNQKQIMFYVVKGYKLKDYDEKDEARNECEEVMEEILVRMKKDSIEGLSLLQRSLDKLDNVRIVPISMTTNAGTYVGMQGSFLLPKIFQKCYDPTKWLQPEVPEEPEAPEEPEVPQP